MTTRAFRIPPEVPLVQRVESGTVPLESLRTQSDGSVGSGAFFLIHGGAGPADPKGEKALSAREAVIRIARQARTILPTSHAGLKGFHARGLEERSFSDAEMVAITASRALEENPLFNAGIGAALQGDGIARVSAAYMDSTRSVFSSVANIAACVRPSELACFLQTERFTCLDGMGAESLARNLGVPQTDLVTKDRHNRWLKLRAESAGSGGALRADGKGTIGCVALDAHGNLCALTSTGGVGNETPGRLGDTPTVAGNYCSPIVAVSCTGFGEQILACAFAARLATRVEDGLPLADAMRKGIAEAHAREFGLAAIAVALDPARKTATWCTGTTEGYFIWAGFDGRADLVFG